MSVTVSVVVPVYNEEDSVAPLHAAVAQALDPLGISFELIFVDDGSKDDTIQKIEAVIAVDPRVIALKFRRNAGQTAAMAAGIEYARGEMIVTMDGDLQNDPADIPMMLEKIEEGYDLVVGWRINRQDKFFSRRLPSMIANRVIGYITGLPIRDNGCSLKIYRRKLIQRVPLYSEMHRFIPAMTIPFGAQIAEVGVRHHARRFGSSKYGLSRTYKVILDLITIKTLILFSHRPLARFSGAAALVGAIAAAIALEAAIIPEFAGGSIIGSALVALTLSLALFLLLLGAIVAVVHQAPEFTPAQDPSLGAALMRSSRD